MHSAQFSHIPGRKTRRKKDKEAPTRFFALGEIRSMLIEAAGSRKRPELAIALETQSQPTAPEGFYDYGQKVY